MADTGNPWFIPFAEPSDLVRDWPALSSAVGTAVAAGLSAAGPAGIGSNVVQTVKTDTFSTNSTSYTTVTGLSATITPTSATSKVLIVAQLSVGMSNSGGFGHWRLAGGNTSAYEGGAASGRVQGVFGGVINTNLSLAAMGLSIVYLDSPDTTSPTAYTVEARQAQSGSAFLNRSENDGGGDAGSRGASSITVIEVAV
jgi:hypothetical protein